jgi:hypothetical protein
MTSIVKFCLLTVPWKWQCASSVIRRLFSRSGSSVSILWNWWPLWPDHSNICNLYGWIFRWLCRVHCTLPLDMPNAWACLREIASGCGQWMQTLGQCSVVCKLRTSDPVTFYIWPNLHATALPIDGLHLEMGPPVDSVHTKIHADTL